MQGFSNLVQLDKGLEDAGRKIYKLIFTVGMMSPYNGASFRHHSPEISVELYARTTRDKRPVRQSTRRTPTP
jgi:hypothetical protein